MLHKNDCEILAHICASLQAGRMASLGGKCLESKRKQPFGCFLLPVRTPEPIKFFFIIIIYLNILYAAQLCRGDHCAHGVRERFHFRPGISGDGVCQKIAGIREALKKISLAAGDPFCRVK